MAQIELLNVRKYFLDRGKAVDLKEYRDAFNQSNPKQSLDRTLQIEYGPMVGLSLNQTGLDANQEVRARIFLKGAKDNTATVDQALSIAENYFKECLRASNRLQQQNGIRNITLESMVVDPIDASNDNTVIVNLVFRVLITIAVEK